MNDNSLQTSIIERVKKVLDINTEIEECQLYKLLHDTMINSHPDKFTDEKIKNQAEEKFKQLQNLKKEFDKYLEQQRLNRQVAIFHSQDDEKLVLIKNNSDKDLEIINLNSKIKELSIKIANLENEIDSYKKQLKNCQENYNKRISEELNYSRKNIQTIYKPKRLSNIVGSVTSLGSLSLLLPQVKEILSSIGINIFFSSIVLISISVFWVLSHLRNNMAIKLTEDITSKIFSDPDINHLLNIKKKYNSYGKSFFTEKDVYSIVNDLMSKKWISLFFVDKINILRRDIVENIILEFEYKGLIVGTSSSGLEKEFIVEGIDKIHYNQVYTENNNDIEAF